jgi:hypothetical protein
MSGKAKLFKTVAQCRKSFWNTVDNPVHGYRYGTAELQKKLRGAAWEYHLFYRNIKPYDKTGLYQFSEKLSRLEKSYDLKRTNRGTPKKGHGKKSKIKQRDAKGPTPK